MIIFNKSVEIKGLKPSATRYIFKAATSKSNQSIFVISTWLHAVDSTVNLDVQKERKKMISLRMGKSLDSSARLAQAQELNVLSPSLPQRKKSQVLSLPLAALLLPPIVPIPSLSLHAKKNIGRYAPADTRHAIPCTSPRKLAMPLPLDRAESE